MPIMIEASPGTMTVSTIKISGAHLNKRI